MSRVWNVGLIGCGAIAVKKHLPLIKELPELKLRGLCSRSIASAQSCAAVYGDESTQVFSGAEEMLACPHIDIIVICTPADSHARLSIAAMEAGKHVICEKPMASSAIDAEKMLKTSRETGKMLHISFQNRYSVQAEYARRLVAEGYVRDIYYTKAYALRRRAVPNWGATTKGGIGNGALSDIGCHAIDLALSICGDIKPKYAVATAYNKIARIGSEANYWGSWSKDEYDVEDTALGFIVMEDGMSLTVEAAYALNVETEFEASIDVFGAVGGLSLRPESGVSLIQELCGKMCITQEIKQQTPRTLTPDMLSQTPARREYDRILTLLRNDCVEDPAAIQACIVSRIIEGLKYSALNSQPYFF